MREAWRRGANQSQTMDMHGVAPTGLRKVFAFSTSAAGKSAEIGQAWSLRNGLTPLVHEGYDSIVIREELLCA
ncbi:hypothetical protein, partial [Bowmanella yangjiangensis]